MGLSNPLGFLGIMVCIYPTWQTAGSGTLNDANTSDELETTKAGALIWIGVSFENLVNGDDFDLEVKRWDGAAWLLYKKYEITKAAGAISVNTGGGATVQYLVELNLEILYLDSVHKLQLELTKNSATDRDIPYWYNKWE